MSVALDAAQNLPKPRLPRSLGAEGRDPVFTMFTTGFLSLWRFARTAIRMLSSSPAPDVHSMTSNQI
ncbi:MAG: hypothetical protein DMG13_30365 [Acidobacteria bacterium]|nr:MAG: hypothetical protein DMG13_30365 [Acidobacteriota bacterium]